MTPKTGKKSGYFAKIKNFLVSGQWDMELTGLPKVKRLLISLLRILTLALKEFSQDKCLLWASALTYITTLSIVPFLAVAFTVTKAFKLYETLYDNIIDNVREKMPDFVPLVEQVLSFTENVNISTLGIVGVISVLAIVITLLGNVEKAFNQIWIVKKARPFFRKLTDYLTLTFLLPISLFIAFTLLSVPKLPVTLNKIASLPPATRSLVERLLPLFEIILPVFFIWLALTALYKFMPNTKIRWRSISVSALIISIIWLVTFTAYINLQVGVERNEGIYAGGEDNITYTIMNLDCESRDPGLRSITLRKKFTVEEELSNSFLQEKKRVFKSELLTYKNLSDNLCRQLYNSELKVRDNVDLKLKNGMIVSIKKADFSIGKAFAQLPVLLLLMYISWAMILLGAEFAYAHQNISSYQKRSSGLRYSDAEKQLLSLILLHKIADRFISTKGKPLYNSNELADELNIPYRLVTDVLNVLERSNFVLSKEEDDELSYSLGCPPDRINIFEVLKAIREENKDNLKFHETKMVKYYRRMLEEDDRERSRFFNNTSIQKIFNDLQKENGHN